MTQSLNSSNNTRPPQAGLEPDQAVQEDELLTIAEVAAYLKISRRTAWRWCKNGRLPAGKVGRQWRISRNALRKIVSSRGEAL